MVFLLTSRVCNSSDYTGLQEAAPLAAWVSMKGTGFSPYIFRNQNDGL
jgi:hypothetical protein